ncbi:MAG: hypothetical protein ACXQS4_06505, partial [Methermicoccaceae archaeon]
PFASSSAMSASIPFPSDAGKIVLRYRILILALVVRWGELCPSKIADKYGAKQIFKPQHQLLLAV